mmetsp:Transcript_281/g.764  ORF Transcript_281/g.764 Transcript_281/m.764 type:complete len:289 (-) Transcript_281:51-917(-)
MAAKTGLPGAPPSNAPPPPTEQGVGAVVAKLTADFIASFCASLSVSPVVTSMDRAITRNAAGAQKLWPALGEGLMQLARNPIKTANATPTRWLVFVYTATYASANMTSTLCGWLGYSPVLPVLAASTAGNMTTGIAKDRAFARMYGVTAPKAMPFTSYGLFFSRDVLAMAFIFTLPPLIKPQIKKAVEDGTFPGTEAQADLLTRLSTPVISQLFTTPLHLLGLSWYNSPDATLGGHAKQLADTYPSTVMLRMLRIIPAFSVGGVVNSSMRQEMHKQIDYEIPKSWGIL